MPLELIADRPGHAVLREYEDPPLAAGEVRIATQFSAVKHGTEFRDFRFDSADATDRWDPDLRLHRRGEPAVPRFPKKLGEGFVGIVTEVGEAVRTVQAGDRVYAHGNVADTHVIAVEHFSLRTVPAEVPNQNLVYDEAAMYALGGIRDGQVRLGERVAVFGLGAIGQMAVQMAKLSGARWVAASDPIERRRAAAARHGADVVFDPAEVDVGLAIKQMTDSLGVDVSIETSSSHAALYDALRSTRFQGRVALDRLLHRTGAGPAAVRRVAPQSAHAHLQPGRGSARRASSVGTSGSSPRWWRCWRKASCRPGTWSIRSCRWRAPRRPTWS